MMEYTKQSIALKRKAINAKLEAAKKELAELDQFEALAEKFFPEPAVTFKTGGILTNAFELALGVPTQVSKKDRIINGVESILLAAGGKRRTSKELIGDLLSLGIEVGGKDPVNNIGAYLSPCDKFNANRKKGGWGLVPQKKASPNDAVTSKGLISNGSRQDHQSAG